MSEETIIRQCAPTLAGLKTGSLFPCPFKDTETLTREIKEFNNIYVPRGLCLIPLRFMNGNALLYLFRPSGLQFDLCDQTAREILERVGYPRGYTKKWLACLVRRFRQETDFPHEVGLFLGYPPEDVKGFIDNKAAGYKCSGIWKVYGDVEKAQITFRKYKKCTETYCRLWRAGSQMEQLAVSDKKNPVNN